MSLLTLAQVAPLLACRDRRTARKRLAADRRLAALGVPVLELGGRVLVDEADLLRARHARALDAAAPVAPAGGRLALGARLWDAAPPNKWGRAA